jgi:hypothetical protein
LRFCRYHALLRKTPEPNRSDALARADSLIWREIFDFEPTGGVLQNFLSGRKSCLVSGFRKNWGQFSTSTKSFSKLKSKNPFKEPRLPRFLPPLPPLLGKNVFEDFKGATFVIRKR